MVALGSANKGVCLTRRPADDYIYLLDSAYLDDTVDGIEDSGKGFI